VILHLHLDLPAVDAYDAAAQEIGSADELGHKFRRRPMWSVAALLSWTMTPWCMTAIRWETAMASS
jgi:hypothetical protein